MADQAYYMWVSSAQNFGAKSGIKYVARYSTPGKNLAKCGS